jgi:hypothetical protein
MNKRLHVIYKNDGKRTQNKHNYHRCDRMKHTVWCERYRTIASFFFRFYLPDNRKHFLHIKADKMIFRINEKYLEVEIINDSCYTCPIC